MRNIMYEDCNNNVDFLEGLFIQIQALSDQELSWSIKPLNIKILDGDIIETSGEMEDKIKL